MKNKKILFSVVLVVIVTWIVAYLYEPHLPEKIPSHWNLDGEVDGYMNKPWGVYMMPLISTISSFVLFLLPSIAPKGFKLDQAKKVYEVIILVMAMFYLGIMVLSFEAGMNQEIDMNQWVLVGIGALFLIIGNYLSKVPKNFFLGIRTPWTLSSDVVWYKTHRLASWTFVITGVFVILGGLLHRPFSWMMMALTAAVLIPVIYSLVIYKKVEGFKDSE